METNNLTQEQRFEKLQQFKRNLSTRLEERGKKLQEELARRKAQERKEILERNGYSEYSDCDISDFE